MYTKGKKGGSINVAFIYTVYIYICTLKGQGGGGINVAFCARIVCPPSTMFMSPLNFKVVG